MSGRALLTLLVGLGVCWTIAGCGEKVLVVDRSNADELAVVSDFAAKRGMVSICACLERILCHTFECDSHRFDRAVFIEVQSVNATHAVVSTFVGNRPSVVNDIPVVCAGLVDHRIVARACGYTRV